MAQGLNVNDVIAVSISLTPPAAAFRNFAAFMVVGPSDVIDVSQRKRQYADIEGVAADFGVTAPEYLWAQEFFSQDPQPNLLYVGRWALTATAGILHGAILTPLQRLISTFNAIVAGAFYIMVDGVPIAITGLNFSAAVNLNGVAALIQTALRSAGATNSLVTWDANNFRFNVESGTTGILSAVNYARAPTAFGSITFASQPVNNSIITLNGTVTTFVTGTPTAGQVQIGGSLPVTLASLVTFLNASTDTQNSKCSYSTDGVSKLYIVDKTPGTGGNSFTLVAGTVPATNGTVSGGTLSGGTGTDVSVTLGLSQTATSTGSFASVPVAGVAAETLLSCLNTMGTLFTDWYGVSAVPAVGGLISDADNIAAAGYIQAAGLSRTYWISTQNTNVLDPLQTSDLCSVLASSGYDRTCVEYSSTNPYCIASIMGMFATINYSGSNTTITGKFKLQPGVIAENLTETQAATLLSKNCNVYAMYQNGVAITQEAEMSSGTFIDSRINADWLGNYVQTNAFNFLRGLKTKLPQTDAGTSLLKNNITASLQQAVVNGYLARGIWNADSFGLLADGTLAVNTGDTLQLGYYIYAPLVASQAESDRQLRRSVPFQIAAKEAGAIHSANISILVNP